MKIKREHIFEIICSPGFWQLLCMAAGGGLSVAAANMWNRPYFVDIPVREVREERGENSFLGQAEEAGESLEDMADRDAGAAVVLSDGIRGGMAGGLEKEEEDLPGRFNFAYYFDPETEQKDVSQSYGGRVYQELLNRDGSWMAEIYGLHRVSPETMAARLGMDKSAVMGTRHLNGVPVDGEEKAKMIPSWNRFQVTFRNGDGTAVMGHSNIKEILSVASVYGYFNQEQSYDFLRSYADSLWNASHSYKISVSNVYYCQGECLYGEDSRDLEGGEGEEGLGTPEVLSQGDGSASAVGDGQEAGTGTGSRGAALSGDGSGAASQGAASSGDGSGERSQEPDVLPQGYDQGISEFLPAAVSVGETSKEGASGEGSGQISQEPIPGAAAMERDQTERSAVQENVLSQSETAADSGSTAENAQGIGQVSQEPIPETGENAQGMGQVSHEPIPETEGNAQGMGQVSHEPIPETGGGAQSAGQISHEPVPETGENAQSAGQVSHEPIPASGENVQGMNQGLREPVPETGGSGQGSGQTTHEPIPASGTGQGESSASSESAAAVSESKPASGEDEQETGRKVSASKYCQGHIDLNVSAVILGMDGKKSLFTQAAANGGAEQKASSQGWVGWKEGAMEYARAIAEQDWYEEYGLTGQRTLFVHNPLSGSEVASYMAMLPQDTSQKRRKVVEQALLSIGCIPYYWGGKPSGPGFENNHFGTVISPDEDGRILRGLDCSGWINWVYWTTFGASLPAESTSGLMSCGKAVEKKDLKAGDILIRAGDQPHVYLFLAWAQDGSMYLIHETTGNVNNVTIGVYDLDLPYYRCLIDEG